MDDPKASRGVYHFPYLTLRGWRPYVAVNSEGRAIARAECKTRQAAEVATCLLWSILEQEDRNYLSTA